MEPIGKVFGISRLRMETDGEGVTTLVTLHGCPLRCKYCLNPQGLDSKTKTFDLTPSELYERIRIDKLYFLSTGGGVTFGGGEPLLYSDFIAEFAAIDPEIAINIETSLNVPYESVERVIDAVDHYYIDVKDTDPVIYKEYTGRDNSLMIKNLSRLIDTVGSDRITIRLPLIPNYNSKENIRASKEHLSRMGIKDFDEFTYRIKNEG